MNIHQLVKATPASFIPHNHTINQVNIKIVMIIGINKIPAIIQDIL
jgi:hypothetical protein